MASYNEWCGQQLSKLSNEETRPQILQEFKDYLTSIPREEFTRTAPSLELPPVFDCLNDSNSEQVDLACEVLSLCMNNLTIGESTNKYGVFLERALNHPFSAVKLMALNEIKRNIENEDVLIEMCKRQSLLINVIKCVGDEDLEVAKKGCEIVRIVGVSTNGLKQLTSEAILKSLHEVMGINEIVRFRVYEVFISLCAENKANFVQLKAVGLLNQILDELDNNDVLLRLNVLELLSNLGATKHGFAFLESGDILKKLILTLDGDDLVTVQLCEPGILKFFGNMAHWKPMHILEKYPSLFQRLYHNLEGDDFTVIGVSLDVLGHVGGTNEGKIALASTGPDLEKAIKIIAQGLPSMPTETKVRGLNCFEHLLRIDSKNNNNQMRQTTKKWWSLIDENPINLIWNYAKNPFFELRIAAFGVLAVIAEQEWGQEAIQNTSGLIEFLLDRNENKKKCKEVKYGIVEIMARSHVFDQLTLKRLKEFVKEGPFYVQTVLEVAIEGND